MLTTTKLFFSRFGYWLANTALKWLVNASRWITANPFILVLILLITFILTLAGYNQKAKQLRVTKQDLLISATLVSRLREDSTALKNTINTAMATITINYAKQAKTLQADSVHAAALSDDQLDAETDSILSANRQFIKQAAQRRNKSAVN
ncbi:hypothetical protein GCM10028808_53850 [Spirosoma migulaei]